MKFWYILTPVILGVVEGYVLARYPFGSVHVPVALLSLSAVYARGFLDGKSYLTMVAVAAYIVDVVAAGYHGQIVLGCLLAAVITVAIQRSASEHQRESRRHNRVLLQASALVGVYGLVTALWVSSMHVGLITRMAWYVVVVGGLYAGMLMLVGRYREAT